jgi:peptidoglycan/LPS O-acetylase OafA/YrhL
VSRAPAEHGLRYAPGLDGIRAFAVAAVVAYHIGTTSGAVVLPGGFLGVDVFFVLSGYLITSLLVVETNQHGRISIRKFYVRRARRLLPALFALLLIVGAVGALWLPQQAARLRGDLIAALGYYTNWWLIAENSSYFATDGDRPALLTHLWSLAVEEQYYLIWPLILVALAAVRARRGVMLVIVLAGVVASAVAAAMMYDPFSDPSRVYYGTDTRAVAPLLGAALALAVRPWKHRRRISRGLRRTLDTAGIMALLGLAVVAAVLSDSDDVLYLGGFSAIALLGAVVVGVAGHPGTALGEMLGTQPLRWLGERSYAIYLWHWPVCVLTRPGTDIPVTGWANAALRVAIAIVLADLSYRFIETPIRRGGFLAVLRPPAGQVRTLAPVFRVATLTVVMIVGGAFVGVSLSTQSATPAAGGPVDSAPDATLGPLVPEVSATPVPGATKPPKTTPPPQRPKGTTVAFFGDSQAMTLLINKPADLGKYINAIDASIEGCGVLLGNVASRSGERRNLTNNCRNWKPEWNRKVNNLRPEIAVIMIGAWDVFDLTLDGTKMTFGSADWDANFMLNLTAGVDVLRAAGSDVALSLLPCYRPLDKSAGFWPERGDDERTRHVNELLTTAAQGYGDEVHVLEPPTEFCTKPSIAKNTAYRWDGIHYYKKGAALYFRRVLPQLLQL